VDSSECEIKFIELFNKERPHEALDMQCPADVYQASTRPYQGLPDIDYPFHDRTIVVTHCGRICLGKKKINFRTGKTTPTLLPNPSRVKYEIRL